MTNIFDKYEEMSVIKGALAFKKDIDEIEAKAEKAYKEGFNPEEASAENMNLAVIAAVFELLNRMTPECGNVKDRGWIIFQAAQMLKIAADYNQE